MLLFITSCASFRFDLLSLGIMFSTRRCLITLPPPTAVLASGVLDRRISFLPPCFGKFIFEIFGHRLSAHFSSLLSLSSAISFLPPSTAMFPSVMRRNEDFLAGRRYSLLNGIAPVRRPVVAPSEPTPVRVGRARCIPKDIVLDMPQNDATVA